MAVLLVPVVVIDLRVRIGGRAFDLSIDVWHLLGVSVAVLLLGLVFGALAMLIGALTGAAPAPSASPPPLPRPPT